MAKAEMDLKVSVEKAVHDAMTELAKRIFEEHYILINEVSINWIDVSSLTGKKEFLIKSLQMKTTTNPV